MSKVDEVLEVIKGMTLIELRDLNKAIEALTKERGGMFSVIDSSAVSAPPPVR